MFKDMKTTSGFSPIAWIAIHPRSYLRLSMRIFLIIFLLHLVVLPSELHSPSYASKFFSFRHELNLPTFMSTLNLFLGAAFSAAIIVYCKKFSERFLWFLIAALLSLMGFDEASGLHEYLATVVFPKIFSSPFAFQAIWLNYYLPFVFVAGTSLLVYIFLFSYKNLFMLLPPPLFFLFGAVGVEFIAFELGFHGSSVSILFETIEESVEMISIIWLNYNILRILSGRCSDPCL